MDLRQLRYFVAVADTGGFSAAAAALHVAQSALSRQVRGLEEVCGGPLFERGARGVLLTEAGALLLTRARFLLAEAESTVAEVSDLNNVPAGLVRLAAPPSFGDILFPPLAANVLAKLPAVRLELREALNDAALVSLRQGGLDFAVVSAPESDSRIDYVPLCMEPMLLVGQPGDALLSGPSVPLDRLPDQPLILPVGSGWVTMLSQRLGTRADHMRARTRVRVQSPGPMKAMILAGLGYGVLPASAVRDEVRTGALSGAPIEDFSLSRILAVPRDRPVSRAARAVIEAVRAETAGIVGSGDHGWRASV